MESKNNLMAGLTHIEASIFTVKNMLRLFVVLAVILAVVAGLGWEQYAQLGVKYDLLAKKHERLNRIYLQMQGR